MNEQFLSALPGADTSERNPNPVEHRAFIARPPTSRYHTCFLTPPRETVRPCLPAQ